MQPYAIVKMIFARNVFPTLWTVRIAQVRIARASICDDLGSRT